MRGGGTAARAGVVVMAKRPVAGAVKTRLAPAVEGEQAAGLYAAMLEDRCAQVARLRDIVPAVALAGHTPGERLPECVPGEFAVVDQPEGGLGAGLAAAAAHFHECGLPALLLDSDSPTLPDSYLERALESLHDGCDLVVGPSEDGGYYAIGLRRPQPELFRDMPWSTDRVTATTLERATSLRLRTHVLPTWWDVDTPRSLERLEAALMYRSWPNRTAQWLRERAMQRMREAGQQGRDPEPARTFPTWRRLSSREVYTTPWLRVREDRVELPNGQPGFYSVVDCGQCVGVLPFADDDTVLVVRQHRYVAGRVTLEMPTGGVHEGEEVSAAARRELAEEAGVSAETLEYLGAYHTSKSVMDETAHLFVARGLSPVCAAADDTEFLRVERLSFDELLRMVLAGEVPDSMTIIAALRLAYTAAGTS